MAGVPHPWRSVKVTTAPTGLAVELSEMLGHLNLPDGDPDADYVRTLLAAATTHVQERLGRKLIQQTITATYDGWPAGRVMILPWAPLVSVSSVSYVDGTGTLTVLSSSSYTVRTEDEPGAIQLDADLTWPTHRVEAGAIRVVYVVGYGSDPTDVPELIRQHIMVVAATMYEYREAIVSGTILSRVPGARAMSEPYRVAWS